LGFGVWGLGFGLLGFGPKPQSPIPNPHLYLNYVIIFKTLA